MRCIRFMRGMSQIWGILNPRIRGIGMQRIAVAHIPLLHISIVMVPVITRREEAGTAPPPPPLSPASAPASAPRDPSRPPGAEAEVISPEALEQPRRALSGHCGPQAVPKTGVPGGLCCCLCCCCPVRHFTIGMQLRCSSRLTRL